MKAHIDGIVVEGTVEEISEFVKDYLEKVPTPVPNYKPSVKYFSPTEDMKEFLRENKKVYPRKKLAKMFNDKFKLNITEVWIYNTMFKSKIIEKKNDAPVKWSKDEDVLLEGLCEKRKTDSSITWDLIAEKIGRSRNACKARASMRGFTHHGPKQVESGPKAIWVNRLIRSNKKYKERKKNMHHRVGFRSGNR